MGYGAGFYCDATQEPWSRHFKMYSYIADELPKIISENFPTLDKDRVSIMGHSMGGGAAVMFAAHNPKFYKSFSALCPRCNITNPGSLLAVDAIQEYFGDDLESAKKFDCTEVIKAHDNLKLPDGLIDFGTLDEKRV